MESCLTRAGYQVRRFLAGQPALGEFSQSQGMWTVAVLDMNLPDMAGQTLAQQILDKDPDIKILMVSGLPAAGGRGNPSGARVRYLQKPFRPASMLEILEELLQV